MQVATNAHPSPWRYRPSDRYRYLPISSSVLSAEYEPNSSNLSAPLSREPSSRVPTEEGTTRVVTGWPRRPRVEEKSDPDAQFPLSRWPSPPLPIEVCPTNELTSAIHQIDRSGNGCALCKRDGNEMICLLLLNLILYYACMYMYDAIEGSKDDNLSIGIFCSYLSGLVRGAI